MFQTGSTRTSAPNKARGSSAWGCSGDGGTHLVVHYQVAATAGDNGLNAGALPALELEDEDDLERAIVVVGLAEGMVGGKHLSPSFAWGAGAAGRGDGRGIAA